MSIKKFNWKLPMASVYRLIASLPLLYFSLIPTVVHAAKLSDWFDSWIDEFTAYWPVVNMGAIVLGITFALIGVTGALSAKKNNQPAASWQVWFMIGGVILTILMAFVAALGGSLTGDGSAVESSTSGWGFD